MRRREKYKYTLLSVLGTGLLGTGLYLLRDQLADQIESASDKVKDAYDTASGRVRRASRAITGEDRSGLGSTAALLVGVGVGVTLGILFAPASGEQIRRNIADTFQEFGGRIRSRVSGESHGTGPTPAERL
jgi:hypothetical protein